MIKTTIFAITPYEEKVSSHSYLLFIVLVSSLVSREMSAGLLAAHHNDHRKHDEPTASNTSFRNFSVPECIIAIHRVIKQYQTLNWTWEISWYHCYREEGRNNDTTITFHQEYGTSAHEVTEKSFPVGSSRDPNSG